MEETQRERHARIDQSLRNHLEESERRFKFIEEKLSINDKAHEEIHLAVIEVTKQNQIIMAMLARYNWLAKGVMGTLFVLGVFAEWFVNHGKAFIAWLTR